MNKLKTRRIVFYTALAAAIAFCWAVIFGIALYRCGMRLTTVNINPAVQTQSNTQSLLRPQNTGLTERAAHSQNEKNIYYIAGTAPQVPFRIPTLGKLAACAHNMPKPPSIAARSAVVIDAASGELLFEKNPDQSIPPASLTKLVAIYTAMQAVEQGTISLTDVIAPPWEAWATNIPPGSSLMFLGKNQRVSVEELILGMSVVSGNDAAVALAIHTAGSVSAFVKQMNEAVASLGLQNTHFDDASGLSEYNRTTARDFARFAAVYVRKYPEHLERFHSVRELRYPQQRNMLKTQATIRQPATNTLLTKLDGCDGIKTGFIYESGFNIALTAQRNGIRFIAVILGGAGQTAREGKAIREKNGKALMEWAFSNFSTVYAQHFPLYVPAVPIVGAKEKADRAALLPLLADPSGSDTAFTIRLSGSGLQHDTAAIYTRILLPANLSAPIVTGQRIGNVRFLQKIDGQELTVADFPLVAYKDIKQGSALRWKYDNLALKFYRRVRMFF